MITIINKDSCCGCSACLNVCPKHCISMMEDKEGFQYPSINVDKCIDCGLCEKVCIYNKEDSIKANNPLTFAALNNDNQIREQSSSGGLFSIFSMYILNKQGVVYGVAMDKGCKSCFFLRVDKNDHLHKLYGSKYFQANVGSTYQCVKSDLVSGKNVLFSGTPCQVAALKLFLGKDYSNLYTIEVICHGVPSPALWNKYLLYLEDKYNAKIERVNFRSKKHGWHKFGLTEDGYNITQYLSIKNDPYMIMFLRNYSLRPSCYNCKAKKIESMADLTIGDFWGIENIIPEMDDDLGTSIVIIQTDKGKFLVEENNNKMKMKKVLFEDGVKYNRAYDTSCNIPAERSSFFIEMNNLPFEKLQARYCKKKKGNVFIRGLRFAKRIIRRGGVNKPRFSYGLCISFSKHSNSSTCSPIINE